MQALKPAYTVQQGKRYRLTGVLKDVVMLGGFTAVEFDFVADNPGPTLFHCHQQLHMDYGFMAMFNYA